MLVFLWNVQNFKCKVLITLLVSTIYLLPVINDQFMEYYCVKPVLSKAILIVTLH